MSYSLLLRVLRYPETMAGLNLADWDSLLTTARHTRVLGRFYSQLLGANALANVPAPVCPHLESAHIIATEHARMLRWEVNRIQRALFGLAIPVILLKGAAYALADLPCAAGRLASDVDILVAKEHLNPVEQALRTHGWVPVNLDDYDQQYYRRWMHELPPLRHPLRGTMVDVHHNILPETSRLQPNPARLLAAAVPLPGLPFSLLAPSDLVLHSAVHTFYDGDLNNRLREVLDLHDLLNHYGRDPEFWRILPERARELGLTRPLFYGLRYSQRLLGTVIPTSIWTALREAAPPWPVGRLMDALVERALLPEQPPRHTTALATRLLYIRSHWLRMPPLLLTRHLLHKTSRRWRGRGTLPEAADG